MVQAVWSYVRIDGDLASELVLDLARNNRIWAVVLNDLGELWQAVSLCELP